MGLPIQLVKGKVEDAVVIIYFLSKRISEFLNVQSKVLSENTFYKRPSVHSYFQTEVIVNVVGTDLDLKKGAVSKAILRCSRTKTSDVGQRTDENWEHW